MATAKTRVGPQSGSAENGEDIKTVATIGPIKVAAIEDNERLRQALFFQLSTAGFEVGAGLSRRRRAEQLEPIELEGLQRSLTSREREVFALITTGLLNKQVGAQLGITERTIKAHRETRRRRSLADSVQQLILS